MKYFSILLLFVSSLLYSSSMIPLKDLYSMQDISRNTMKLAHESNVRCFTVYFIFTEHLLHEEELSAQAEFAEKKSFLWSMSNVTNDSLYPLLAKEERAEKLSDFVMQINQEYMYMLESIYQKHESFELKFWKDSLYGEDMLFCTTYSNNLKNLDDIK